MMNVADLVFERACREHPALVYQGRSWNYGPLLDAAEAVAECLRGLGVRKTSRVALYCPNGADYVVLALGILRAGGCLVPVASELAVPERKMQLELTAPQLLIAAGPHPWLPQPGQQEDIAGIRFEWCSLEHTAGFPEDRFSALNPAFIRFSSGTTGASKGVLLSHETLLARVQSANRRLRLSKSDRVLWTLPMAHHFAVSIMLYLLEGATTILEDSHLAADVLTTARATESTVFYGSPFHLALLAAEDSGRNWPSLRLAIGTAAAVPAQVCCAFQERFGLPLSQGFGIIEAGLPLLNTNPQKPTSIGRPDDFEVCLKGSEGENVQKEGEVGELMLRGPGIFDAYLLPWRERAAVMENGWFATGDLASRDAEGFLYLRGRRKSVINFGGMKFFPEEVEEVLLTHPEVRESRVSGEAHERWGAVAVAEVVPRNAEEPPTAISLSKHCRAQLAAYKVPVRFRCVDALPRTASGKLKR